MSNPRASSFLLAPLLLAALPLSAQQEAGPQTAPPPPVAPAPAPAPPVSGEKVTVPAGTTLLLTLENGISTRTAKPGDSVYFRTSFPVTQNNRIVIPVGSYLRGEVLASRRPGRVKGRAELRLRLDTLIFPNGYTVDLNASPSSADTGGNEKVDREGKIEGESGKGKDAGTIATTTAQGAVIGTTAGAIAGNVGRGVAIGGGVGAAAGLAAVLLTRGPEAQLPRGSSIDVVLERSLVLDGGMLHFNENSLEPRRESPAPRQQPSNTLERRRLPWPLPPGNL